VVEVDGERHELTGLVVLIANAGELIPGLLGPRRPIDPASGSLEVLVLGGRNVIGATRGGLELLLRHDGPHGDLALRRSAGHIRVEAAPAQPIQIDGDVHGVGWIEARVMPGALRILVPAPAPASSIAGTPD
jgi:diacylglycerol kinase family enzyme